ncbi:hypothetical protein Tco_0388701 [Tanacetum coccineum]
MFPQPDSGLAIPSFLPGDDPIAILNKEMTMAGLQCNKCRGDRVRVLEVMDHRVMLLIQEVTMQQVQGVTEMMVLMQLIRQGLSVATTVRVKAQESGVVLDEEQLAFLANPGVAQGSNIQTTMLVNAAF